jgi:RNA polymerase sigma-70 factor (ECF subfamily)
VLFRFLIRRVGRDIADELLGETFRIAFEKRSTFDCDRASAKPWLYGIATHLVAKHHTSEPGAGPPSRTGRAQRATTDHGRTHRQ